MRLKKLAGQYAELDREHTKLQQQHEKLRREHRRQRRPDAQPVDAGAPCPICGAEGLLLGSEISMSEHVKGVASVASQIEGINKKAGEVADRMKRAVERTDEALDAADGVSESLNNAADTLRSLLGLGNNPPADEAKPEDSLSGRLEGVTAEDGEPQP